MGPMPRHDGDMHARILDAAAACLTEGGFTSNRMLSAIARRAGVSRPTLYKYGGTLDEIKEALIERELTAYLAEAVPLIDAARWDADYVADLLAFLIGRARAHPLLSAAVRDVPDMVLPWFTVRADITVARVTALAAPVVQDKIDRGELPPVDVPVLIDVLTRVVLSLVFVNSAGVDADDPDDLRRYLRAVTGFVTLLPGRGEGAAPAASAG
ncbi:TetR family transcriptional regulator [Actinomadura sp. LD22]|uniref:TetR family transcriptional regulator n=2 Tax=Actinomadura physcomitrii TaxID=2650748 RepID=A0A6I4MEE6_9ACTN|nr:TetR family transcriptional regulator [Actinomadura physcomitrii]